MERTELAGGALIQLMDGLIERSIQQGMIDMPTAVSLASALLAQQIAKLEDAEERSRVVKTTVTHLASSVEFERGTSTVFAEAAEAVGKPRQ